MAYSVLGHPVDLSC